LIALVAVALAAGYFLWLRDSSLVAVTEVEVKGVGSGDREAIVAALTREAESMTTLNVDRERLEAAGERFPTIESLAVDAGIPSSLSITVTERSPALVASRAGEEVAVAADGTVLPGTEANEDLPRVEVDKIPRAGRLTGEALPQALVAAHAPEPLRALIKSVRHSSRFGVEVRLRGGIALRFGAGSAARAKWAAATAVLADPGLESVSYVDVRVPRRPAVGGSGTIAGSDPDAAAAELLVE